MNFTYTAPDFFDINSHLTEDERAIRDTIREFVQKEVVPIIDDCYVEDKFPKQLIPMLAELGVFGATIQGYGCAGVSYTAYGVMMQELERGDSGLRSFVSVQGALAMHAINAYGTEEQKKKYLPKMAKGEFIGCFGLTEHDFGSNPAGLITRARKDGGDYILNGAKMWITSGSIADVAIIWAKLEGEGLEGGGAAALEAGAFVFELLPLHVLERVHQAQMRTYVAKNEDQK
jgi:glutaryl-CoA dehydrogenase